MECNNDKLNKISKKITLASFIILSVFVALFLVFFILTNNRISQIHMYDETDTRPVFNQTQNEQEDGESYMIKEFNGKIAVYKNNDFQYQLDVFVFTLPKKDQQLLTQGIYASSEQELNDILSSYY